MSEINWYREFNLVVLRTVEATIIPESFCDGLWERCEVLVQDGEMTVCRISETTTKIRFGEKNWLLEPSLLVDLEEQKIRAAKGTLVRLWLETDRLDSGKEVSKPSTGKFKSLIAYQLSFLWRYISYQVEDQNRIGPIQSLWLPPKQSPEILLQLE